MCDTISVPVSSCLICSANLLVKFFASNELLICSCSFNSLLSALATSETHFLWQRLRYGSCSRWEGIGDRSDVGRTRSEHFHVFVPVSVFWPPCHMTAWFDTEAFREPPYNVKMCYCDFSLARFMWEPCTELSLQKIKLPINLRLIGYKHICYCVD